MPRKKPDEPEEISLHDKEENDTPRRPVPTFVTEVVEDAEDNGKSEVTTDLAETVHEDDVKAAVLPANKLVKETRDFEEVTEPEPEDEPQAQVRETVKQKQVVEELFSKKDSGLTEISVGKGKKKHSILLWALIVVVAAVTTGLGLFFFSGSETTKIVIAPSPTPTTAPVTSPSATPTPVFNREEITIQVLNGGGVPGAASKMKSFLTELGYSVIDVGNTDDYSYEQTEIEVKSGSTGALSFLKTDLGKEYSVGSASATLDDEASYDVRVIVGKE